MKINFFNAIPIYYGLDVSIMNNIGKLKILVLDVEAKEDKVTLVSTYEYHPLKEIEKDDIQCWEENQLDELSKYLSKFIILAGHNIKGYDLPILLKNNCWIDTATKSIFDTCKVLSSWAQSLQVGSARSLLELARVLKEQAKITDEEIRIKEEGKRRLFSMNKDELVEYNINDVVITCKVLNVIFPFIATVSAMTQIPLSIVQELPAGLVAEYFFLRWCELHRFIPEYRSVSWNVEKERVYASQEGVLIKPEKGWICQYDINMMYPSYVLSNFIDPTLLVEEPEETKGVSIVVKDDSIIKSIRFDRRSGIGILWSAVKYLRDLRLMTKKLKKQDVLFEPLDKGVKAILNALGIS